MKSCTLFLYLLCFTWHKLFAFIFLDVHLGVCKYNTSSICQQNNTKACITDGDCTTNEKCCKSPCGLKCITSIATTGFYFCFTFLFSFINYQFCSSHLCLRVRSGLIPVELVLVE